MGFDYADVPVTLTNTRDGNRDSLQEHAAPRYLIQDAPENKLIIHPAGTEDYSDEEEEALV
ncbi:hypothetical protein OK016_00525 [Vibrio chagasii]|nr:hypothetical protein [Vibrio chagasii]